MTEKRNWGGARKGSGRKTRDGVEIVETYSISLSLDQDSLDLLKELGGENISLGVRRMAQELLSLRNGNSPRTNGVDVATTRPKKSVWDAMPRKTKI